MAEANPMGDSRLVSLDLADGQVEILRRDVSGWIDSFEADLRCPERLEDVDRTRTEAAACRRLLSGVEAGQIRVPDDEAHRLLRAAADAHDRESEYDEVVSTHEAMHAVLAALAGKR